VLEIHPEAADEAKRARNRYRGKAGPTIARAFERAIRDLLRRIEETPRAFEVHGLIAVESKVRTLFFEVRRALPVQSQRGASLFPLVVFYYVRSGVPFVLAVAHGRRRPGYWMERRFEER
jgi:hypothetical protein